MFPESFMKFSKPVKIFILIPIAVLVFPFFAFFHVMRETITALFTSLKEAFIATLLAPVELYKFAKYNSIHERMRAESI